MKQTPSPRPTYILNDQSLRTRVASSSSQGDATHEATASPWHVARGRLKLAARGARKLPARPSLPHAWVVAQRAYLRPSYFLYLALALAF